MAKVIFKEHPLSNKKIISFDFKEDVNALELIDFLKLKHMPLFCKVNGKVPEVIDDYFVFSGKDVVEISPILEGGGGDGGGKGGLATVLTVLVAVAAIAVSGGALAGVGLAAGSVGAAVAGAAIGIGGNLLVGSLFAQDIEGNSVGSSQSVGASLVDTSVGNSRNRNPFGAPICLPMGNCCRISPPFATQPYSTLVPYLNDVTRFQGVWQVNNTGIDCAQVCYEYNASGADVVQNYFDGNENIQASSYEFNSGNGVFLEPAPASGDAAGYPYEICYMAASVPQTGGSVVFYYGKKIDTDGFLYSSIENAVNPLPGFGNISSSISYANCAAGNILANAGIPGQWSSLGGAGNVVGAGNIPAVTIRCENNKGLTFPTGVGLGDFNGFRHKPFVFLCDPNDPNFGTYISIEFGNAFGWDPVAMAAAPFSDDKIDGNPVTNGAGNVVSADPFCIADAEFCILEEITEDKKTNRVHQIFNFGYGDLKISESQFGTTSTTALQSFEEQFNEQSTEDWPMPDDSCARERVDITEGALLPNNDLASGPNEVVGFEDDMLNWIVRCGVEKTEEIVVEIFANLYATSSTYGIIPHTETIQIQYMPFNSGANWLPLGNATGVHQLTGYDTFPVKEEFSSGVLPCDKYCVRVRRLTQEDSDSSVTNNINFTSVKWFQKDCKAVSKDGEVIPTNYKGQNRVATCISAGTSQSGVLDQYNAKVSTRMWIFDIDEFKATGVKNWVWDCEAGTSTSSNPAFAFLYFLRGGYCNSSADPTVNPSTSPLDGGFTSFGTHNGEHPDNEELLWGGGVSEKRIDIDCICEWACYNHENEFCFDYYLCDDKSVSEVLDLITRAGRATWGISDGKFCPIFEEADQPYVTIFSEENILEGSFQVCYNSRSEFDKVVVTYTAENEESNDEGNTESPDTFDGKPIQITSDVPFSKERGGERRVELVGVRKKKQAQREANIIAAKEFYQKRIYTWDTDIQHLCVTRGDVVLLSNDLTQPSFSSRLMAFDCEGGKVTKLYLTRDMEKPITEIKIKLVCGDIVSATVSKQDDKTLFLTSDVEASQFPIIKDQQSTCNESNLTDETFGSYPEDIMIIGAAMQTPGKRVRITNIDVDDFCKATITAVDEDPAIYAYEFNCCPDPVVLPEEEVIPFVCARVKDITVEDCGDGLIRVCYETEGAYAVQASYCLNGGTPVNVMSGGQFTIRNDCFELQLTKGDVIDIKIMPFVVGTPYSNEDGCITHVVK